MEEHLNRQWNSSAEEARAYRLGRMDSDEGRQRILDGMIRKRWQVEEHLNRQRAPFAEKAGANRLGRMDSDESRQRILD